MTQIISPLPAETQSLFSGSAVGPNSALERFRVAHSALGTGLAGASSAIKAVNQPLGNIVADCFERAKKPHLSQCLRAENHVLTLHNCISPNVYKKNDFLTEKSPLL
jgi:hypothetical protein